MRLSWQAMLLAAPFHYPPSRTVCSRCRREIVLMRSKRHITKRAQQFAGRAEQTIRSVAKPLAKYGFPWRANGAPWH